MHDNHVASGKQNSGMEKDQLDISCSFVMIFAGGESKHSAKAV